MSSGGVYSLATIGAKDVIDRATPAVLDALEAMQLRADEHWCFSDMGCADGGTSLDMWRAVIEHVRRSSDVDIQIVYADQTRNDFNALVQILHGHTDFDAYLPGSHNVHVLESAASFYTPILPEGSLNLGFSATAMHWLSCKPCDLAAHVHMVGASGEELSCFARQAQADWRTLLLHRARELKPGGRLVLVNFCRDEDGRYLGNTGGVNMFDRLNAIWQSFVEDGTIDQAEYVAMTLPQYYNTVDEFSEPFLDTSSDVYRAGLRLEAIETGIVACPFAESFKSHGDAKKFAKDYIPTIRSWNESIFYAALSSERSKSARREIIDAYYSAYQHDVEQNPNAHGMGYVHAYTTIVKT